MAILGIPNAIGFRSGSEQIIKNGVFDKLRSNSDLFERIANQSVQQAFSNLSPNFRGTGYTQRSTHALVFWGSERLTVRFKTPNDRASNDGKQRGYAVFPYLGLSTSAKYGPRNPLIGGAELTVKQIIR
jgi:hypothetical protein